MDQQQILALIIFGITIIAIILDVFDTTVLALLGAAAMIFFKVIPIDNVMGYVSFNTLEVLVGMMLIVAVLKETGIFEVISGLLVGKPMDETFYDDYKEALMDIIDSNIPIVYNLNVGHATPRAIVPFGVHAYVDATEQVIRFDYHKES